MLDRGAGWVDHEGLLADLHRVATLLRLQAGDALLQRLHPRMRLAQRRARLGKLGTRSRERTLNSGPFRGAPDDLPWELALRRFELLDQRGLRGDLDLGLICPATEPRRARE